MPLRLVVIALRLLEDEAISKKPATDHRATRVQYGALPYRQKARGALEILLVTSRESRRWIIPKGWPIKGLKPSKAASREAYEEAGVRGRVARRALGHYGYEKRLDDRRATVPCEVEVFALAVKQQLKEWPERKERSVRWFSAAAAARIVEDEGLRDLLLQFAARKGRAGK